MSVASLFTFVPRSVQWRLASGTDADIGIADILAIFMGPSLVSRSYQVIGFASAVNRRMPYIGIEAYIRPGCS